MATRGVKITGLNNLSNSALSGNIVIPVVDPTSTLAAPDGETLASNLNQIANYILNQAGNLFPEANVAKTVKNNAQPNITSVGTLTGLVVSGNTSLSSTLNVTGNINANSNILSPGNLSINNISANIISATTIVANIVTAKLANGTSNVDIATENGAVTISVAGNANIATFSGTGMQIDGISNLGPIENVKIFGGANHSVLVTDGLGNLSWGPDVVAAGPNTAIQFNDEGNFAGSENLTFNKNTNTLTVNNVDVTNQLNFPAYAGGQVSFVGANTSNNISFIIPETSGTSQQVLGIIDQDTQKMGWKTVPVYYVTVGMRNGSSYLSSPDPVLRVYPIKQRDGTYLNVNTTP